MRWPMLRGQRTYALLAPPAFATIGGRPRRRVDRRTTTRKNTGMTTPTDDRFYIELQRAGLPTHEAHVRAAVPLPGNARGDREIVIALARAYTLTGDDCHLQLASEAARFLQIRL